MLPSWVFALGIGILFITSIALQVILTILGSFRKRCSKKWFVFFLSSAYQLVDFVATISLGMIPSFGAVDPKPAYLLGSAFSSFVLFLLGGPDSITAISLVDNELCLRHSLQLVYRVGLAGYIQVKLFFVLVKNIDEKSYDYGGPAAFISAFIMLFLAGTSKYVERIWGLHLANMDSLRDSMLPSPNPGPRPTILNDGMEEAQTQSPAEGAILRDSMLPPTLGPRAEPLNVDDHHHTDNATEAHSVSMPIPLDEYNSGMGTTTASAKRTSLRDLFINDEDDDYNDIADAQSVRMPTDEYASRMAAPTSTDEILLEEQLDSNKAILLLGHRYFCNFKCLFVDLMVRHSHVIHSQRFFLQYPCDVAFQLIDLELSFMYDMLFTKALVVRTCLACTFRFFRLSVLLFMMIASSMSYGISTTTLLFNPISWVLAQEMFEIIQMLLSERTVIWLNYHGHKRLSTIILSLVLFPRLLVSKIIFLCGYCGVKVVAFDTKTLWWHNNLMAQYNLLSFCFEGEPTMLTRILHLFSSGKSTHESVQKSKNATYINVPHDIKDFIYQQFKEMVQTSDKEITSAEFRNHRGKWGMRRNNCAEHHCLEELGWSVDVEFDQSILIWHVATDLCYYYDDLGSDKCEAATLFHVQVSKVLTNYLLYLLLIFPFMLNNKIGKIRFQDTCATIKSMIEVPIDKRRKKSKLCSFIFQRKKSSFDEEQAKAFIKRLLMSDLKRETKSDESKSVLLEAHKLARLMQSYAKEKRWKIVSGVWVEILSYAARNCSGKQHAERLCEGGEFLTKIWLLMAHLGMVQ